MCVVAKKTKAFKQAHYQSAYYQREVGKIHKAIIMKKKKKLISSKGGEGQIII